MSARRFGVVPTSAQRRLCRPHDCADVAAKTPAVQGNLPRQVGTIRGRGWVTAAVSDETDESAPEERSAEVFDAGHAKWPGDAGVRAFNVAEHPCTSATRAQGATSPWATCPRSRRARIVPTSGARIASSRKRSTGQVGTILRSAQSAIGSPRAPVELHVHAMTDMTMHPANIRHSTVPVVQNEPDGSQERMFKRAAIRARPRLLGALLQGQRWPGSIAAANCSLNRASSFGR